MDRKGALELVGLGDNDFAGDHGESRRWFTVFSYLLGRGVIRSAAVLQKTSTAHITTQAEKIDLHGSSLERVPVFSTCSNILEWMSTTSNY